MVPAHIADDGTTESMVTESGRRYEFVRADLTAAGECERVVQHCVDTLGGLDILVNSAGICLTASPDDFDRQLWDPMLAVNLTAGFEMAQHAGIHMRSAGAGKIINIASLFSYLGGRTSPAYAATKAGIVGFTRAYCDDLAEFGIQVNAIAPGYFVTALTTATRADEDTSRRVLERIPAGRWGDPADLMGAVVFLSSHASDYVNGQVLVVDGGYLVR